YNVSGGLVTPGRNDYPAGENSDVGFRVAAIPEPSSITLLVCGALGLLVYGWRRRRM
ncbi:MAG: PEP-CTERM sorting domain-containing protein, partial [Propionibacteriaceae bacterium]|nr:PEP-CTERM sorting domain-containing protein [Propionibacteriaceae bacterium]